MSDAKQVRRGRRRKKERKREKEEKGRKEEKKREREKRKEGGKKEKEKKGRGKIKKRETIASIHTQSKTDKKKREINEIKIQGKASTARSRVVELHPHPSTPHPPHAHHEQLRHGWGTSPLLQESLAQGGSVMAAEESREVLDEPQGDQTGSTGSSPEAVSTMT